MIAGSFGPSHAWVHLVDFDTEVSVHGMDVAPMDIVHADQHGAGDPVAVAKDVPEAVMMIARKEAVTIGAAQEPGFNFERSSKPWVMPRTCTSPKPGETEYWLASQFSLSPHFWPVVAAF